MIHKGAAHFLSYPSKMPKAGQWSERTRLLGIPGSSCTGRSPGGSVELSGLGKAAAQGEEPLMPIKALGVPGMDLPPHNPAGCSSSLSLASFVCAQIPTKAGRGERAPVPPALPPSLWQLSLPGQHKCLSWFYHQILTGPFPVGSGPGYLVSSVSTSLSNPFLILWPSPHPRQFPMQAEWCFSVPWRDQAGDAG